MRRPISSLGLLAVVTTVGGVALAATVTQTNNNSGGWQSADTFNLTKGNELSLASNDDVVDDWYRVDIEWASVSYEIEAEKDDNVIFSSGDECYTASGNTVDNTDTTTVSSGSRFRLGTDFTGGGELGNILSTIPSDTLVPLPAGVTTVSELRFVSGGGRISDTGLNYVVNFHYSDATTGTVTVPMVIDTTTGSARDRDSVGQYDVFGITNLVADADNGHAVDGDGDNNTDCGGNGADEIWVLNPQPGKVVDDISFTYPEFSESPAVTQWLGGPLAVTIITDQNSYESAYDYFAIYEDVSDTANGSVPVANAMNACAGIADVDCTAEWYSVAVDFSFTGDPDSKIEVTFGCGDDDNSNGILSATEIHDRVTFEVDPSDGTSFTQSLGTVCRGRYGVYEVVILAGGTVDDPRLQEIRGNYDPDHDGDGFTATVNGAGVEDCNDTNDTIRPNAVEIVGDGVDQNCNGQELCYLDDDNDNAPVSTSTIVSTDLDCNDPDEGTAAQIVAQGNVDDCNDNNDLIFPNATEIPGDQVDQNCNNQEICFVDADNDGAPVNNTVVSTDLDCIDPGEGTQAELTAQGAVDCNDAVNSIFPLAVEVRGDQIDQNCNGQEICYLDDDNDNSPVNAPITSTDTDCTDTDEGTLAEFLVGADCNDADPGISPLDTEITGDNIDQNCDGIENCWTDADNDNAPVAVVNTGGSNDDGDCDDANEGTQAELVANADCNDGNNAIHPLATEITGNEVDENCNGQEICWLDDDNDNAPGGLTIVSTDVDCQDTDEGTQAQVTAAGRIDCADTNSAISPLLPEITGDNIDQNCDTIENCWTDADDDNAPINVLNTGGDNNDADCNDPREGTQTELTNNPDCNDGNSGIHPLATETVGDEIDQNCNNQEICYVDSDNDGARTNGQVTSVDVDCDDAGEEALTAPIDCVDTDNTISPLATEIVGDGIDQTCDGAESCYQDIDNDNAPTLVVIPSADPDCNDSGEGTAAQLVAAGNVADCNDNSTLISPLLSDLGANAGNNVDNDCNNREICYQDVDNDGDRATTTFETGAGDTTCNGANEGLATDLVDCDDNDGQRFHANLDTLPANIGNGIDNDCNNVEVCYDDDDNDDARDTTFTEGSDIDCADPGEALATAEIDCADNDAQRFPSNPEITGNNKDNNCDDREICFVDADLDGHRALTGTLTTAVGDHNCTGPGEAEATDPTDCRDVGLNAAIFCSTASQCPDICGSGEDEDCDGNGDHATLGAGGFTEDDADGLQYSVELANNTSDCNDDTDGDSVLDFDEIIKTATLGNNIDSDGDGVDDYTEIYGKPVTGAPPFPGNPDAPLNTDATGGIDALDTDDDGDGVLTSAEKDPTRTGVNQWMLFDTDGDGIPNFRDNDDDGDGIPTLTELAAGDTDGDGDPNYLDNDDDDDTFLTIRETPRGDSDGDLTPDHLDDDDDGDSILTRVEAALGNTDGVDEPNYLDTDDDNDGIPSRVENLAAAGPNVDGIDPPNYLDTDSDEDGYLDSHEAGPTPANPVNSDAGMDVPDTIPDYLDTDSDGDSILDVNEKTAVGGDKFADSDSDGDENRIDEDDDGDTINTRQEQLDLAVRSNPDGDGIPHYLDDDSDGDGYSDFHEWNVVRVSVDDDGDGQNSYIDDDSDGDTVDDDLELGSEAIEVDTDNDGFENRIDNDDDGDTRLTQWERAAGNTDLNTDGDGIPDHVDADDDNDLVPTRDESPGGTDLSGPTPTARDTDGDGVPDFRDTDDDGDGYATSLEVPSNADPQQNDTDGDGVDNFLDTDDDGDGISSEYERTNTCTDPSDRLLDTDNIPDYLDTDSDGDGYLDADEWAVFAPGIDHDSDQDGCDDYVDGDSDDDTVVDANERRQNFDGGLPNGDTLVDRVDPDDDADGILTRNESVSGVAPNDHDHDGDGEPNYLDTDDDDDSVSTRVELQGTNGSPATWPNTDLALEATTQVLGDSVPDHLDVDDDNDGELTISEDADGSGNAETDDTDGDLVPNYRDPDDDGDGILTIVENSGPRNYDGDGFDNHLDVDSDNDSWHDRDEAPGGVLVNTDGTGAPDFGDLDSDDDSVDDELEGSSPDLFIDTGAGPTDPGQGYLDTDGDGLLNRVDTDDDNDCIYTIREEWEAANGDPTNDDYDGDGIPDFLDDDDDDDLVPTLQELLLDDNDVCNQALLDTLYADTHDFDSDAIKNFLDVDDDNDTVLTRDEVDQDGDDVRDVPNRNTDRDGAPDHLDTDDDGDVRPTVDELADGDTDNDLVPNYLDWDDDNDYVGTRCEDVAGTDAFDTDSDDDEVIDGLEWFNYLLNDTRSLNRYDDFIEPPLPNVGYYISFPLDPPVAGEVDERYDLVSWDPVTLTLVTGGTTGDGCVNPWDRDGDGTINALDRDDDGDNFLTIIEGDNDVDCLAGTEVPAGDGIPNFLDFNTDGDEYYDIEPAESSDTDSDGILDIFDCALTGCSGDGDVDLIKNCSEICPPDEDGNDTWCRTDPDIDNDGVIDGIEAGPSFVLGMGAMLDTDNDGSPDPLDRDDDDDGFLTVEENGTVCPPGVELEHRRYDVVGEYWVFGCDILGGQTFDLGGYGLDVYPNTDAAVPGSALPVNPDDVPDFIDADDDGDGVPTDALATSRTPAGEGLGDLDGDGLVDYLDPYDFDGPDEDADGDGLTNEQEALLGTSPYNVDTDRDGIPDNVEVGDDLQNAPDFDGDGLIDAVDPDDDNDGVPTAEEGTGDSDGDGLPNHQDLDSDDDGILDGDEVEGDTDCDGLSDLRDTDDEDGPCAAKDSYVPPQYERQGCQCDSTAPAAGWMWLGAVGLLGVLTRRRR